MSPVPPNFRQLRRMSPISLADRSNSTAEEQERFFQLSVSLSAYVGQDTLAQSCPDGAAVIDLCSRVSPAHTHARLSTTGSY